MNELDEGKAQLTDLTGAPLAEVEYSILFTTTVRIVRPGFPPVSKTEANVRYIRAIDGASIAPGEYLLERPAEINRVKSFDGTSWYVLSLHR